MSKFKSRQLGHYPILRFRVDKGYWSRARSYSFALRIDRAVLSLQPLGQRDSKDSGFMTSTKELRKGFRVTEPASLKKRPSQTSHKTVHVKIDVPVISLGACLRYTGEKPARPQKLNKGCVSP